MTFHSHSDWYWTRLADGSVGVCTPNGDHVLSPSAWASIVASVSARGETGETFRDALVFHSDEGASAAPGESA